MPVQYPYPTRGWSTGNMKMAKIDPRTVIDESQGIRTLEQERKRRETEVSGVMPEDLPTTSRLFPGKKKKQLEKEQDLRDQSPQVPTDPYEMSPKQLRSKGYTDSATPSAAEVAFSDWGTILGKQLTTQA